MDADKNLAAAGVEYRRTVMDEWFEDRGVEARIYNDVHRARGVAWSAHYGVLLLTCQIRQLISHVPRWRALLP